MNKIYRVVWNATRGMFQVAAEFGRSRVRQAGAATDERAAVNRHAATPAPTLAALLLIFSSATTAWAVELPDGGRVMAGDASISREGNTVTIDQSSHKAAIDWDSFSIGKQGSVRFNQPGKDSAALNRVTGNEVSDIRGALQANGRVFLINPNGVSFSPGARVDVGSLVASTLDISVQDFIDGNYTFEGDSSASITNAGAIKAADGGTVALIAANIVNTGTIDTPAGETLMGAGSRVRLDLGGPVPIEVEQARLDTLIDQGGAIRADGGMVYLTAKAAGELTASVINHTGITQARTLVAGEDGRIMLMGDRDQGTVQVAGTLDASAPQAGDGGFIETSAATVDIAKNAEITTKSATGKTGTWLIDPLNFVIAPTGGNITGQQLSGNLARNSVQIYTYVDGAGCTGASCSYPITNGRDGDILVNDNLSWSSGTTLTLNSYRDIQINRTIDAASGRGGKLELYYGQGSDDGQIGDRAARYQINAPVNLQAGQNFVTQLGRAGPTVNYTVITALGAQGSRTGQDLQGLSGNLAGNYALGANIDASATENWDGGAGFMPIGPTFSSQFDGLGHTVTDLVIDRPTAQNVGLFGSVGSSGSVRNVELVNAKVTGSARAGALVGRNLGAVESSRSSGEVKSEGDVAGGLVGQNESGGQITYSASTATVSAVGTAVGGLVGYNVGATSRVRYSYATGDADGLNYVGGLVGWNGSSAQIIDSYATGAVRSRFNGKGGLVGENEGPVTNSYAVGNVANGTGLVGLQQDPVTGGYYAITDVEGNLVNPPDPTRQETGRTWFELTKADNYDGWDFDNVWAISSDPSADGYSVSLPYLRGVTREADINRATLFESGTGTQQTPWTITSWQQLAHIDYSNATRTGGHSYRLTVDLDRNSIGHVPLASASAHNGAGWDPIGNESIELWFDGNLDGQGHVIRDLTINRNDTTVVGLFAGLNGARVHDLGLDEAAITGGANAYAGGLAGNIAGSTLDRVWVDADIRSGSLAGGLAGLIQAGSTVQRSFASGSVSGNGAGGLAGASTATTYNNVYSTADVVGNSYAGGLIGSAYNTSLTVDRAYSTGDVGGEGATGGLIGDAYNPGPITRSYYATTNAAGEAINQQNDTGYGQGRTRAQLMQADTFGGWDISSVGGENTVWRIYEGDTGPLLRDFLTALTVTPETTTSVYDCTRTRNIGYGTDIDGAMLSGELTVTASAKDVGRYRSEDGTITLGGLYSGQQGYDISYDDAQLDITQRAVNGNVTAGNKTYDGTTRADISAALDAATGDTGRIAGDHVSLTADGAFENKNAGSNKTVNYDNVRLTGSDADNYRLTSPSSGTTQASINRRQLGVQTSARDKVYDGTAGAMLSTVLAAQDGDTGRIANDNVRTTTDGAFTDKNAGTDKTVNYTVALAGDDADNYVLSSPANGTVTADISRRNVGGYISARNRVYDGTADATFNAELGPDKIATDDLNLEATGNFADKNVGNDKTVDYTARLTGADANNYTLTAPSSGTSRANITRRDVRGAVTAADRVYDGTTQANLSTTVADRDGNTGKIAGDDLSIFATGEFVNKNAGTGKSVRYSASLAGTDAGNYRFVGTTSGGTRANITQREVATKNIAAADKVYDGTASAVVTGTLAGRSGDTGLIEGDALRLTVDGTFADKNAGTNKRVDYTAALDGADAGNYRLVDNDAGTTRADIDKAAATVTANSRDTVYNGQQQSVDGFSVTGLVNGEDASVLDRVTTTGGNGTNAGSHAHTASGDDENYNLTFIDGTLDIAKANATVTANSATTTYNGQAQSVDGFSVTGLVGGEGAAVLQNVTTAGGTGTNAGQYALTASGQDENYELSFIDGALTIDKADATVTANSRETVYTGQQQSVDGFTVTGLVNGEDAAVLQNVTTTGGTGTNAGAYAHTATGDDENYNLAFVDGTLTIDKANATVTANSRNTTYLGREQSVTGFTVDGLVNGETASVLDDVTTTGGVGSQVGEYAHRATGSDGNYNLTFVDGVLDIDKARATITGNSRSTTYNGQAQSVDGYTVAGLVDGDDASVIDTIVASGASGIDAGEYFNRVSGSDDNYDLVFVDGLLEIAKADATVTANSRGTTYNGQAQSVAGFTVTGLVNGEDRSVLQNVTTTGGTGTNAGQYALTAAGQDENYNLAFVDGALTIDKANATVTANSQDTVYNGQQQTVDGFTVTGLVNGEDASVLDRVTTTGGNGTNAGRYAHTASGDDENYNLTFVDGGLNVDKANATVTANSASATYSGTEQSVTGFTTDGLVNGEDQSVLQNVVTNGGTGTNAGQYAHTASGSDENYNLTFVDGALNIDKANATVTANSRDTVYNGQLQSVSGFSVTGLVNGEDASVLDQVATTGGTGTNAGRYVLAAAGTDENYELTFVDGALDIAKANATVIANSATTTYSGTEQSVTGFTAEGLVNGETIAVLDGVNTRGGTGTNAGEYVHTAAGADENYNLSFVDGALNIDKADAIVTANSRDTVYNGQRQSVDGFTVTGLVNGEDSSVLDRVATTAGTGTNAGQYAHTASGDDENYNLSFVDGTLDIAKADATVTANSATTTYTGQKQSVDGFTVTGLVNGEDASVLDRVTTTGGTGTNAGQYVLTGSGDDENYDLTFVDGALSIERRAVTVTADDQRKTAGDMDPELTWTTGCGTRDTDCGLIGGETLTGALARDAGETAGDYAITQGSLDEAANPNYAIDFVPGTLSIAPIGAVTGLAAPMAEISILTTRDIQPGEGGTHASSGIHWIYDNDTPDADTQAATSKFGLAALDIHVVDGGIALPSDQR